MKMVSFRSMGSRSIIFVALLCFGVTTYGAINVTTINVSDNVD